VDGEQRQQLGPLAVAGGSEDDDDEEEEEAIT
jgi:hypothetical protein